jgi:5-methyltetrahydropteroyltriglutamate--homocysteine methyltransferase
LIEAVLASDGTDPFSPICDDTTTSRETAFAKIRARVAGTALASEILGGG